MLESDFPDARGLVQSLRSRTCPACGGGKVHSRTFCSQCYFKVTADTRRDLYAPLGDGYERAVLFAMRQLGRTRFVMPAARSEHAA